MTDLEKYKAELNDLLNSLAMYMHNYDVDIVRNNITKATTSGELDAIRLGLKFHEFRINKAKDEGLIVDVEP